MMTGCSNIFYRFLKKYLISANIILIIIFLFILSQLFSTIKETNQSKSSTIQPIKIRITSENKVNFQTVYYGENNFRIWQIKTKEKLKLGENYDIIGMLKLNEYKNIDFNDTSQGVDFGVRRSNLSLSNAVSGIIEVDKIVNKLGCDFLCSIIFQVNKLKSFASTEILRLSCNYYGLDWKYISPFNDCKDISALMQGLLLGGSQGFSTKMQNNFRITGITHIVAISGFNITLIIVLVESLLKKFEIGFSIQFWLILTFLLLFIVLVGTSASVLRAGFMGFFMLLAKLVKRPCSGLRALILASIVLLLYNPFYLYSVSFQLSFLATFGLITFLNLDDLFSQKWLTGILENAWSTIVANLYTLPVLVNTFGYFSPLSILPNIIILPLIPFIMLFDLFTLLPVIGRYIGFFAALSCAWILGLVEWFASWLPLVYIEKLNWLEMVLWYIFLLGSTQFLKKSRVSV